MSFDNFTFGGGEDSASPMAKILLQYIGECLIDMDIQRRWCIVKNYAIYVEPVRYNGSKIEECI